jgi:hypothetical protein
MTTVTPTPAGGSIANARRSDARGKTLYSNDIRVSEYCGDVESARARALNTFLNKKRGADFKARARGMLAVQNHLVCNRNRLGFVECFEIFHGFTNFDTQSATTEQTHTRRKHFRDQLLHVKDGLAVFIVGHDEGRIVVLRSNVTPALIESLRGLPQHDSAAEERVLAMTHACMRGATKGWERTLVLALASSMLSQTKMRLYLGVREDTGQQTDSRQQIARGGKDRGRGHQQGANRGENYGPQRPDRSSR